VSEFTATQVHELLGIERSRLRIVHHGVRMPAPRPVDREKIILHVGAIQTRKNIARLVRAFESAPPDWRLVLAGSAGFGAEAILDAITRSPARDRISILGYVTADVLANWYARAMILAFPSLDEGFGIPILEAMAAGVPVLTSNRGALAEVAGDAALLVNPESLEELSEALRKMIVDDQLREDLKQKGLGRSAGFTCLESVPGVDVKALLGFFVDPVHGDFQSAQELVILSGQLDLSSGFIRAGCPALFVRAFFAFLLVAFVETDGRF
jgi:glycosyltransferase involved in cell wall biosynthesis